MQKIRVAVVGAGFMGVTHAKTLMRLKCVDVVSIVDSNLSKAAAAATELQIPHYHVDYRDATQDHEIDVIHNCTPNHMHYEVSKSALTAGKHVLSEKPLAVTVSEGSELWDLARANGLHAGINFIYRYYPLVQHIRESVHRGELGRILIARGGYFQDWLCKDTAVDWRVSSHQAGKSRALADIGSHWCDMVQYLTGQSIIEVLGETATMIPVRKRARSGGDQSWEAFGEKPYEEIKVDTEDYASVLFRTTDGIRGSFAVSQVSPGHKNQLTIELNGEIASFSWEQQNANHLWIGYNDRPNEILVKDPLLLGPQGSNHADMPGGHVEGWLDSFTNLLEDFYKAILCECPLHLVSYPSFGEGVQVMKVIEAILLSNETRSWVSV